MKLFFDVFRLSRHQAVLFSTSLIAIGFVFLSSTAIGGAVYSCSPKQTKCVVKLDSGEKDYPIKIFDEKARLVAVGSIIKKKGTYGLVRISKLFKDIRKGYPVMVDIENEQSEAQWTSMVPYIPRDQ